MEIKRDRYLNTLISKEHNGLIKVITGMRRCGKSYLLFTLFKEHLLSEGVAEDHIIETAFDAFENKKYRDPDVLYPYLKEQIKDDAMYYVLLDEVQLLGEFESILNSLIRMKNVDVYVTGSNARFLSKDVITEFRGRGDEVHMYPLSFAEFMSVYQGIKQDGWNEYMLYGGNCFLVGLIERNVKRNAAFAERLANKNIERCGQVHAEHSIRGEYKEARTEGICTTTRICLENVNSSTPRIWQLFERRKGS